MSEHYEYAVMMPSRSLEEAHRGPFGTFEEAQQWIYEAFHDDIKKAFEIWYVAERKVGGWYRVDE